MTRPICWRPPSRAAWGPAVFALTDCTGTRRSQRRVALVPELAACRKRQQSKAGNQLAAARHAWSTVRQDAEQCFPVDQQAGHKLERTAGGVTSACMPPGGRVAGAGKVCGSKACGGGACAGNGCCGCGRECCCGPGMPPNGCAAAGPAGAGTGKPAPRPAGRPVPAVSLRQRCTEPHSAVIDTIMPSPAMSTLQCAGSANCADLVL